MIDRLTLRTPKMRRSLIALGLAGGIAITGCSNGPSSEEQQQVIEAAQKEMAAKTAVCAAVARDKGFAGTIEPLESDPCDLSVQVGTCKVNVHVDNYTVSVLSPVDQSVNMNPGLVATGYAEQVAKELEDITSDNLGSLLLVGLVDLENCTKTQEQNVQAWQTFQELKK